VTEARVVVVAEESEEIWEEKIWEEEKAMSLGLGVMEVARATEMAEVSAVKARELHGRLAVVQATDDLAKVDAPLSVGGVGGLYGLSAERE
jgi:hypothetical protein